MPVLRHALASRISAALEAALQPGCVAFQSDQRVRVLATGKATYPDASMVCGEIEGDPAEPDGPTIRLASGATLDLASLYADLPA